MPILVRLLLLADLTMIALYILDVTAGRPYWKLTELVNLDGEGNLPTWYSSGQLLILGCLLAVFAVVKSPRGSRSWALFALPALCWALSLDEIAQVHEWLGSRSDALLTGGTRKGTLLHNTGIWMFIFGPLFLIVAAVLWRKLAPFLQGRDRVIRLYLVGFFLYAASAFGIEIFANAVTPGLAYSVQVVSEELGEMVGVTLLVWATLELLASHDVHLRVGAHRPASLGSS